MCCGERPKASCGWILAHGQKPIAKICQTKPWHRALCSYAVLSLESLWNTSLCSLCCLHLLAQVQDPAMQTQSHPDSTKNFAGASSFFPSKTKEVDVNHVIRLRSRCFIQAHRRARVQWDVLSRFRSWAWTNCGGTDLDCVGVPSKASFGIGDDEDDVAHPAKPFRSTIWSVPGRLKQWRRAPQLWLGQQSLQRHWGAWLAKSSPFKRLREFQFRKMAGNFNNNVWSNMREEAGGMLRWVLSLRFAHLTVVACWSTCWPLQRRSGECMPRERRALSVFSKSRPPRPAKRRILAEKALHSHRQSPKRAPPVGGQVLRALVQVAVRVWQTQNSKTASQGLLACHKEQGVRSQWSVRLSFQFQILHGSASCRRSLQLRSERKVLEGFDSSEELASRDHRLIQGYALGTWIGNDHLQCLERNCSPMWCISYSDHKKRGWSSKRSSNSVSVMVVLLSPIVVYVSEWWCFKLCY